MKLQSLAIILIIIVLPITLIISAYTKIQIDTISVQTLYATQLKDATYDAISAFQLNTTTNNYSTVSDSMRRDVTAAIETFMKSIASNLGMSGATEETIKTYIPAIVFTLYDGYYIYAPSYSYKEFYREADEEVDGYTIKGEDRELSTDDVISTVGDKTNAKYEHVLKPYIYYTVRYQPKDSNTDIVVNYTLDNYIVVYGTLNGEYVTKAGYLVNPSKDYTNEAEIAQSEELIKKLPVTRITFTDNVNKSMINDMAVLDIQPKQVKVTSQDMLTDRLTNGTLLENVIAGESSDIAAYTKEVNYINYETGERSTLPIQRVTNGEGKEIDFHINRDAINAIPGLNKKYYATNKYIDRQMYETWWGEGDYTLGWYIGGEEKAKSTDYYVDPQSATKYYNGYIYTEKYLDQHGQEQEKTIEVEGAVEFTKWVIENLGNIKASDAIKQDKTSYSEFDDKYIFQISDLNDPEDEASDFCEHKRNVIKLSIQDNLSQAMASYNQNSEALKSTYNYRMPILTENEWDRVLKNVCMISFMQGIQVGTKIYNDYTIVTSTKNKEYVSEDSIYYVNNSGGDGKYHKLGCSHLEDNSSIVGYRNSEFDRKYYEYEDFEKDGHGNPVKDGLKSLFVDRTEYYYMHENEACYYCIINSTEEGGSVNWRDGHHPERLKAYKTALAREKFNFYKTNSYMK